MSIGPISSLASTYLQSILGNPTQKTGASANSTLNSIDPSSFTQQPDNGQLSPFAQMLNDLQQIQQSNPAQYQKVTAQIATNLQNAAQTAQSNGNTTAANQLTQLSTDFSNASKSGQLPSVQDLAQASGHHHHGHHHHGGGSSDSNSSGSTSQSTDPLLAGYSSAASQSNSTSPMSIIMNTLSQAGIGS